MVLGGLVPSTPLTNVVLVALASVGIWIGSGWLESSAERLSAHHGLPAVIQGSVVVAVGSSVPELASVVFTALAGAFDMGVGAVVGSAIFNILVIPAAAGILTREPIDSSRALVYKEAQFYMIAVSATVITFALAVIYYPAQGGSVLVGQVTRPLAAIPLLLYGLYLFIQWQDVGDHDPGERPDVSVRRAWARLASGLVVIVVTVEQLVGAVDALSRTFAVPEFLAGVTVIAAATSLPDLLVSVRSARADKGITSLGNVLGSNTFDLLVAIPVGVMIAGTAPVNFSVAAPMMGVLTVATIVLFASLRTDLAISDRESYAMVVLYVLFGLWIVAETLQITTLLRGG